MPPPELRFPLSTRSSHTESTDLAEISAMGTTGIGGSSMGLPPEAHLSKPSGAMQPVSATVT